jgi:hypothetical protein
MAQGKKSFLLYSDLLYTVGKLPDDVAGKLFKLILEYVNDNDPSTDDLILQIAFEPIKQQLKRDLQKWDGIKVNRSESGRLGGIKSGETRRKQKEANEASALKTKQNEANEAVNVNVNVNVNDINSSSLPEERKKDIMIYDYQITDQSTLEEKIIKNFHILFCQARTIPGQKFNHKTLMSQKMSSWMKDLEKIMKTDKRTKENLSDIYKFLKEEPEGFWVNTISSLNGLRKNYDTISDKMYHKNKIVAKIDTGNENTKVFKGNINNVLNRS